MSQWIIVLVGAILVGLIVLGVASSYISATTAKLPSSPEMIQLFVSGSLVGAFVSWLVSSGYFHGNKLIGMITSDIGNVAKEVGLKGGVDASASAAAAAVGTVPSSEVANTVSAMVGGFLNSVGLGGESGGPEMTVGMPAF